MLSLQKSLLLYGGLVILMFVFHVLALKTGFPYGYFWYGNRVEPMLWGVPVINALAAPFLFLGACAIANRMGTPRGIPFMLSVALLLLILTLVGEPAAVREGLWAYRNGGAYFLIPLGAFVGTLFMGSLFAFLFPNPLRNEKLVGVFLLALLVGIIGDIKHGLIFPTILGMVAIGAVAWFDLRRHGWRS